MKASDFDASVRSANSFLGECEILRTSRILKSHKVSEEFKYVTLEPDTLYRDIYMCGLRNGDYNFLLSDYSYLQFSFTSDEHYRLAYHPNPFSISKAEALEYEAMLEEGVMSFEEYSDVLAAAPERKNWKK